MEWYVVTPYGPASKGPVAENDQSELGHPLTSLTTRIA